MKSFIIELSDKPIPREKWVTEEILYVLDFPLDVCDGAAPDDLRAEICEDFGTSLANAFPKTVEAGPDSVTFKKDFRKEHDEVMTAVIERLVNEMDYSYNELTTALDAQINGGPGAWYVYRNGYGVMSEPEMARKIEPGTYYYGAVLVYNY